MDQIWTIKLKKFEFEDGDEPKKLALLENLQFQNIKTRNQTSVFILYTCGQD